MCSAMGVRRPNETAARTASAIHNDTDVAACRRTKSRREITGNEDCAQERLTGKQDRSYGDQGKQHGIRPIPLPRPHNKAQNEAPRQQSQNHVCGLEPGGPGCWNTQRPSFAEIGAARGTCKAASQAH